MAKVFDPVRGVWNTITTNDIIVNPYPIENYLSDKAPKRYDANIASRAAKFYSWNISNPTPTTPILLSQSGSFYLREVVSAGLNNYGIKLLIADARISIIASDLEISATLPHPSVECGFCIARAYPPILGKISGIPYVSQTIMQNFIDLLTTPNTLRVNDMNGYISSSCESKLSSPIEIPRGYTLFLYERVTYPSNTRFFSYIYNAVYDLYNG